MQLTELILAISAWCGNLTAAGSGGNSTAHYYTQGLNRDVAECKKEIVKCIKPLKTNQADEILNCFLKVELPK